MTEYRSTVVNSDGSVSLGTRVVPIPNSLSKEAREFLRRPVQGGIMAEIGDEWWKEVRKWQKVMTKKANDLALDRFPVADIEEMVIGGVTVHKVTPKNIPKKNVDKILINIRGGAFVLGQGLLFEAIPIANVSEMTVLSIDYRLAPEHPYPAGVEDIISVYREILRTYAPCCIGVFGSSSGALMALQFAVRVMNLDLPQPALYGLFATGGDLSEKGDSEHLFTIDGFWGDIPSPGSSSIQDTRDLYLANHDPKDPLVSPIYTDLSFMPKSLLISSTRDSMLSGACILHRALRKAGVPAELYVFEAMPHVHWRQVHLPESYEAISIMSKFFNEVFNEKIFGD